MTPSKTRRRGQGEDSIDPPTSTQCGLAPPAQGPRPPSRESQPGALEVAKLTRGYADFFNSLHAGGRLAKGRSEERRRGSWRAPR